MIVERIIKEAILDGIAVIQADLSLLDLIFCPAGIALDELEKIKTQWTAKPPEVILNYAKRDGYFPSFTIVTKTERESTELSFVGDRGPEFITDEVTGEILDLGDNDVHFWNATIDIGVETQHLDLTMWYYELLKRIMLDHKFFFIRKGFYNLTLSGSELVVMEMENRKPENMFLRVLSMTFDYYDGLATPLGVENGRGRKIAGVLVADDNNPESVGIRTGIHTQGSGT